MTLTIPPHSIEAEQGVLGCILLSPDECLLECRLKLKAGAFYDLRHASIFEALCSMDDARAKLDLITVQQWLKNRHQLEGIGGLAYLSGLMDTVPSAANLPSYLEIVREKHVLRKMQSVCRGVLGQIEESHGTASQLLDQFENDVLRMGDESKDGQTITVEPKEVARCLVADIQQRFELQGKLSGISSGFRGLDRLTNGFQSAELAIVAARPSTGKTALAVNMCETICIQNGIPTAFFSLEMRPQALARRMASGYCKIDAFRLRDGNLTQGDMGKLVAFNLKLSKSQLHIVNGVAGMTILQIGSELRRLVRKFGIKVAFVDYLQKVKPAQAKEKRTYEVAAVSEGLKALADSLGIVVIALAQLSRESEKEKGRRPKMSDLADSAQIERDADFLGMIHRPRTEKDPQGENAELLVAKQRDGEVGMVHLNFVPRYCLFTDPSPIEPSDV